MEEWIQDDIRVIGRNGGVGRLKAIGQHFFNNRTEIEQSTKAFCCYEPWKDPFDAKTCEYPAKDATAFCPSCHIDAVIGDASGITMTEDLANALWVYWFKLPNHPELTR